MKKLINIIIVLTFGVFFSCSSDNDAISDTTSNNNGKDYEFTITINGQVHKVKGNSRNGIPMGTGVTPPIINNTCISQLFSPGLLVSMSINDITTPNYISGQNMKVSIVLPNPLLGINQAQVLFTGAYFDTLATTLGAIGGFDNYSNTLGEYNYDPMKRNIPIIISDLGTPTTTNNNGLLFNFGQTIKGNYSGTIYLTSLVNYKNDIPVKLSIDFKALRIFY